MALSQGFAFFKNLFFRIEFKAAVKTGLVASLSLLIGQRFSHLFNRPDALVSGIWCVLTAIIVLQAHVGGTYKAAFNRFFGVMIGSFMGGLFTTLLGSDATALGLAAASTVLVCSLLNLKDSYRIACASAAVVILLWQLRPGVDPWTFGFFRFLDSCLGIVIAMAIAHSLWPFYATQKLRINMAEVLLALNQYYEMVVGLSFEEEQAGKMLQKIDELLYKNRFILEESRPEMLAKSEKFEEWSALVNDFDILFEAISALGYVYREDTQKIFDNELQNRFQKVVDKTNSSFRQLVQMLQSGSIKDASFPDLGRTLDSLQKELFRFRSTHATQKFHLRDVEHFFVFFYSLRQILERLQKMEGHLGDLLGD